MGVLRCNSDREVRMCDIVISLKTAIGLKLDAKEIERHRTS